jgi:uncharacterized protein YbjT (DUF2867 family)
MTTPIRALVAGGTGLVGAALLARLDASSDVDEVVSLVRRDEPARGKIRSLVVDWDALVRTPELTEVRADVAFCCLGTTRKKAGSAEAFRKVDFDFALAFAHAAKSAGVRRFLLVTSLGANAKSSLLYARTKGEVEQAVMALGFDATEVLRPSMLDGDRNESRLGETVGLAFGRVLSPLLGRYRPIHAGVVADALVRLALDPSRRARIHESDAIAQIASG